MSDITMYFAGDATVQQAHDIVEALKEKDFSVEPSLQEGRVEIIDRVNA